MKRNLKQRELDPDQIMEMEDIDLDEYSPVDEPATGRGFAFFKNPPTALEERPTSPELGSDPARWRAQRFARRSDLLHGGTPDDVAGGGRGRLCWP